MEKTIIRTIMHHSWNIWYLLTSMLAIQNIYHIDYAKTKCTIQAGMGQQEN